MSELCQCRRCRRILIDEEFDNHECSPRGNGKVVRIEVDYWFEAKHPETGEPIISAKALEGTIFWFILRKRRLSDKIPFQPSDESLHGGKSDGDLTEP